MKTPIGVSNFTTKLVEALPKEFKGKLPTIEEIESELKKRTFTPMKKINKIKKPTKSVVKKTVKRIKK